MRAFILNAAGAAENLQISEIETPTISSNEVLVQVKAISINPVDVKSRANEDLLSWVAGSERPIILGWDISGIVTAKGKDVTEFEIGDEVFGMIKINESGKGDTLGKGKAYAEYVAASASHLALKPKNVTHTTAVATTMAAMTAWQALVDTAQVKKGDRVLIHAASGGVGHFAVQIAKYFGAYVIGTSSAANKDFVLSLAADEHIDYRSQRFEEVLKDIDLVLDTMAGETLTRSIDVVKPGGRIVSIPSWEIPQPDIDKAIAKGINLSYILVTSNGKDMAKIASLLESGDIKAHIQQIFKFEDMPLAHKEVEKWRTRGKIVVEID